jgi:hypothetical protein
MPIQRIAGCAAAFGTFARRHSPIRQHAEELPKAEGSSEMESEVKPKKIKIQDLTSMPAPLGEVAMSL